MERQRDRQTDGEERRGRKEMEYRGKRQIKRKADRQKKRSTLIEGRDRMRERQIDRQREEGQERDIMWREETE